METYKLVDDILVISGEDNGAKYLVDGKLGIESDTLSMLLRPIELLGNESINRK